MYIASLSVPFAIPFASISRPDERDLHIDIELPYRFAFRTAKFLISGIRGRSLQYRRAGSKLNDEPENIQTMQGPKALQRGFRSIARVCSGYKKPEKGMNQEPPCSYEHNARGLRCPAQRETPATVHVAYIRNTKHAEPGEGRDRDQGT